MKFILSFFLFLLIGCLASAFLPYWIIVPIGLVLGYFYHGKMLGAFGFGWLSQFLVWFGAAAFFSMQNQSILIGKIASLLGGIPPLLLLVIIGVAGGFLGGLSSWTGHAVKEFSATKKAVA